MELNLKEKVVIVTGGTSGIGEAIVEGFAQEGAHVMAVGRNAEKGQKKVKAWREEAYEVSFFAADLMDTLNCKAVVEETVRVYGGVDILVNNAGVNDGVSLSDGPDNFVDSLKKNVIHYYAMAHYALPEIKKRKGTILNIGSKVANTGQGGTSGYAASKGGTQALTREWAAELCDEGIRVNEVIPAEVWTPLYESWVNTFDKPADKVASITKNIPLGKRFTTSEEIAHMTVFLASDKSAHTTGQIIYVDGGYTHLDRSLTS